MGDQDNGRGSSAPAGARGLARPAPACPAGLVTCHREPPSRALLRELSNILPRVLVVDDGMPRRGAESLQTLAAELGVGVVRLWPNRGKGHALEAGIARLTTGEAPADAVVVLDGDGQHPPDRIPALLSALASAELVVGDRSATWAAAPLARRAANRWHARLASMLVGRPVPDSQCGMRAISGRALGAIPIPGGRYESETQHLMRCLRSGVPVAWVPVPAIYDGEISSFRALRDGLRVTLALLR